jgi:hypothetical protein
MCKHGKQVRFQPQGERTELDHWKSARAIGHYLGEYRFDKWTETVQKVHYIHCDINYFGVVIFGSLRIVSGANQQFEQSIPFDSDFTHNFLDQHVDFTYLLINFRGN